MEYTSKDEIMAVEVQAKQIAGVIATNYDGFQKTLEFVFSGSTLTIKVMNHRHSPMTINDGVVEDESMLDDLNVMMDAQPLNNGDEFVMEYSMPIEWIPANEHLVEPSVPRPEHYLKAPSNLREFLVQLNYLKNFDVELGEKKGSKFDTSKVHGEVRIVNCRDLEVSTWAADTSHACICHRDLGMGNQGEIASMVHERASARCMILLDPLIRSIQCLQSIMEASMLSMSAQTVFAVVPDTAVIVFIQFQGEAGAVTMYLPAYLV